MPQPALWSRWHTEGMEYQHTQWGFFSIVTLLVCAVVVISVTTSGDGPSTMSMVATAGFMVVLLVVVLAFSRLEVTVTGGRVVAAFLFGRPRREIELGDVTAVREVRNSWIQGWGIRKTSAGWMYNVWGLDAVELELTSGEVFRIGTDDSGNLFAVLSLQVTRQGPQHR